MIDSRYPIGPFVPPPAYSSEVRGALIGHIAEAPAKLRKAIEGLTESQLLTPYREGGWTVAQVVHHVPDSHMNAYIRFKLATTEDAPTIKAYDEARWAELPDASVTDLSASLALLESLHKRWVVFLRWLTSEQFDRTLQHPELGTVSLNRYVALYAWHGRHHVAHITTLRERMGW
ncbi:MAG: bacillithiol transferase BstA [Acidobacteria bacterium]|nr:bacillithiol transferase BstA [Acidobacteriota bacterium]